jgi:hypothetical protein
MSSNKNSFVFSLYERLKAEKSVTEKILKELQDSVVSSKVRKQTS